MADAALLALERSVLRDLEARDFAAAVAELRIALANDDPSAAAKLLAITPPDVRETLTAAITEAHNVGVTDAIGTVMGADGPDLLTRTQLETLAASGPTQAALDTAQTLSDRIAADIAKARLLVTAGADITAAASPVLAAANALSRTVTSVIIDSGNRGVVTVARAAGKRVVWVAETDACVSCLRYSGETVDAGDDFPGGLTYGAKSYYPDPLSHPPLHGHCRCVLEVLLDDSYADALRREADRSVLRGFSLESESMNVRVGAARRLIDRGVNAPKTVIAYSRRAIKAGKFPNRGRPAR